MNMRKIYSKAKTGYKLEDKKEFALVRSTLSRYGLPTKNFDINLSNLTINTKYQSESDNSFRIGVYYPRNNVLNMPNDNDDFIHELFHMASNDASNDTLGGCKIRGIKGIFGLSLDEGIAEYFTSLAKSDYVIRYPYEAFFASYIAKIYGMDIFKEHFNGNAIEFYSSFKQDEPFIRNVVSALDQYHESIQKFDFFGKDKNSYDNTCNYFIDFVCEFVKLLQLKKIDENEFLNDLKNIMNDEKNEFVTLINAFFEYSTYRGKDNIYKTIREEIGEEGFILQ